MIAARKAGPGFHIDVPEHAAHLACGVIGVTLTREEADALFDALGAVLDRDAGLPKNRRMPAPPGLNGSAGHE
jgi:hypothetical protein